MISINQYRRLTLVVVIPLLLLGWWLVEHEKILPLHSLIYCQEFESNITCHSISVTKDEAGKALYQNGAVRLWGARLESSFNHSIVTLGHSEIKVVNGETVALPSVGGGIKKNLTLPPEFIQGNMFSSCGIIPYANSDKNWHYSCTGGDLIDGGFYFSDEKVSQKFLNAKILIEQEMKENEARSFWGVIFTALIPLVVYFFLSIVFFLLSKIINYVVHGRNKSEVSVE